MAEVEDLRKRIQELEAEVSRVALEKQDYLQNLESLFRARTEQLQRTMADLERSYDTAFCSGNSGRCIGLSITLFCLLGRCAATTLLSDETK
jgi:hypothetical protein